MMMRIGDRLVAHLGLTSSRWLLLGAVADRHEPPMLSDLSNDALLSLQNISRMVASMEADGLFERFTKPGMGRAAYIRLTDKGRAIHDKTKEQARRFAEAFLVGTSPDDVERMESDLEHLIANLEALENKVCDTRSADATCMEVLH